MNSQPDEVAERLCPLLHPAHPDKPSKSVPGTVLCRGHERGTFDALGRLATFDADADEAAHDQTLSRKAAAPISGDRERPLPIDARITEHRQQVGQVVASWSLLVAEERSVSIDFDENRSLPTLCAFLRRHHDWSVSQPWADDYAGEILALGRRAWSLLHPSGKRQFTHPLMRCVEVDEELNRCPGSLWAFLTPDDPTVEAKGTLVCDSCDFEVTSDRWMSYGRKVLGQDAVWEKAS